MNKFYVFNSQDEITHENTAVIITNADMSVVKSMLNYQVSQTHTWLLANGYYSKIVCQGHPDPKGYGRLMKLDTFTSHEKAQSISS